MSSWPEGKGDRAVALYCLSSKAKGLCPKCFCLNKQQYAGVATLAARHADVKAIQGVCQSNVQCFADAVWFFSFNRWGSRNTPVCSVNASRSWEQTGLCCRTVTEVLFRLPCLGLGGWASLHANNAEQDLNTVAALCRPATAEVCAS